MAHFPHKLVKRFYIYLFLTEEWLSTYKYFSLLLLLIQIFLLIGNFFATATGGLFSPRSQVMAPFCFNMVYAVKGHGNESRDKHSQGIAKSVLGSNCGG